MGNAVGSTTLEQCGPRGESCALIATLRGHKHAVTCAGAGTDCYVTGDAWGLPKNEIRWSLFCLVLGNNLLQTKNVLRTQYYSRSEGGILSWEEGGWRRRTLPGRNKLPTRNDAKLEQAKSQLNRVWPLLRSYLLASLLRPNNSKGGFPVILAFLWTLQRFHFFLGGREGSWGWVPLSCTTVQLQLYRRSNTLVITPPEWLNYELNESLTGGPPFSRAWWMSVIFKSPPVQNFCFSFRFFLAAVGTKKEKT